MKKLLKIVLVIMLVFNIIPFTALAEPNGYEFNEYGMKEEVRLGFIGYIPSINIWNIIDAKVDAPLNKEWTITFSGEAKKGSIDGMVIEKDSDFMPVKIKLKGNQATVTPMESYEPNTMYTLKIFLNNGKRYKMDFSTKSDDSVYVVTKANLIASIVTGEATSVAGKTEASVLALSNALKAGRIVRDNANSTQEQVNSAVMSINQAIVGLENIVADKAIEFKDSNLEKAVRKSINKSQGDILKSDVERIIELTNVEYVKNLEGIQNLKNIKILKFYGSEFTDMSPLSNLINLEELQFYKAFKPIADISSLKNLTNLKILDLYTNSITDISPLKDLIKLEDLNIGSNELEDISYLGNLINLKKLYASGNKINNISYLKDLIKLENLSLDSNKIEDISHLKGLVNLKYLYIQRNPILEFTSINNLINTKIYKDEINAYFYNHFIGEEDMSLRIQLSNSLILNQVEKVKVNGNILEHIIMNDEVILKRTEWMSNETQVELEFKGGFKLIAKPVRLVITK